MERNAQINIQRRIRYAERKALGRVPRIDWRNQIQNIIDLYGKDCYLGLSCFLELQPIDYSANPKVGSNGWEYAFHPDHVVPLSKGGLDVISNIRPCHAYCNQRKAAS
jgi:hypothetical protein